MGSSRRPYAETSPSRGNPRYNVELAGSSILSTEAYRQFLGQDLHPLEQCTLTAHNTSPRFLAHGISAATQDTNSTPAHSYYAGPPLVLLT